MITGLNSKGTCQKILNTRHMSPRFMNTHMCTHTHTQTHQLYTETIFYWWSGHEKPGLYFENPKFYRVTCSLFQTDSRGSEWNCGKLSYQFCKGLKTNALFGGLHLSKSLYFRGKELFKLWHQNAPVCVLVPLFLSCMPLGELLFSSSLSSRLCYIFLFHMRIMPQTWQGC